MGSILVNVKLNKICVESYILSELVLKWHVGLLSANHRPPVLWKVLGYICRYGCYSG